MSMSARDADMSSGNTRKPGDPRSNLREPLPFRRIQQLPFSQEDLLNAVGYRQDRAIERQVDPLRAIVNLRAPVAMGNSDRRSYITAGNTRHQLCGHAYQYLYFAPCCISRTAHDPCRTSRQRPIRALPPRSQWPAPPI